MLSTRRSVFQSVTSTGNGASAHPRAWILALFVRAVACRETGLFFSKRLRFGTLTSVCVCEDFPLERGRVSPHWSSLAPGSLPVKGEPLLPSPPTQNFHALEICAPGSSCAGSRPPSKTIPGARGGSCHPRRLAD